MADQSAAWTDADSRLFLEIGAVAVPARAEQIATILTLLPFETEEPFRGVELGCGQGALTFAILDRFPRASMTALDGSAEMLGRATRCLHPFGPRASLAPFELASDAWLSRLEGVDCVVSSLCLHHLPAEAKQRLFAAVCRRLSGRGAFLIADLVEPQRPEARALFAATWDRAAEAQSLAETGSAALFRQFAAHEWNYFRYPDPADQPSPLFDQLAWLKQAGFAAVDCFWLQAGHAIYGGYKSASDAPRGSSSFEAALSSARTALRATSLTT